MIKSKYVSSGPIPKKGQVIVGFKRCTTNPGNGSTNRCIVTLLIPAHAERYKQYVGMDRGKCRASEARVIGIVGLTRPEQIIRGKCYSTYDSEFEYKIGQIVKPEYPFDGDKRACTSGIHFFMTFAEAEKY